MAAEAQINVRELSDDELEGRLLRALRSRRGRVTEADVVVESGVPPHQVGPGLRRLLALYRSHLSVTEEGELLYEFDPALERRDAVPYARLKKLARALWAGFTVFFKVMISVVLVAYVAAFALLTIAALVAMNENGGSSSNGGGGGRRRERSGGSGFGFFPLFIGDGFWSDPRRPRRSGKRDRPFWKKVFSFVFGPEQPPEDDFADERALLAYIREQGGVIAPTELASRTGWSLDASEQESTRLLARYGGDVEVTDAGQILYTFKDLMTTAGDEAGRARPAPAFWDRWEPAGELTGNSTLANLGIGAMNGFVLFAATVLMPRLIEPALHLSPGSAWVEGGLIVAPALYAALFFGIPLARRLFVVGPENRRRARSNLRRAILREAFHLRSPDPEAIARALPPGVPVPSRAPDRIDEEITRVAAELDGKADVAESGRVTWSFARIAEEAAAAEARRRGGQARLIPVGRRALAFSSAS